MLILLDCRPLQYAGAGDERTRWILSCTLELTARYGVEWLYIIDKKGGLLSGLPPGIPPRTADHPAGGRLITRSSLPGKAGWKLWYDWQIPRLAKKYRPDWVMTTGGVTAAVKIPQGCWMPGSPVMNLPGTNLQAARAIFCFSPVEQQYLAGVLPPLPGDRKILLVPPAAGPAFAPLPMEEREKGKEQYAAGKEYFFTDITGAGEEDVVNLLKAFSRFKKRQLSNMQMVLAGPVAGPSKATARAITLRLETYKYRQDIHWHQQYAPATEGPRMAGAAYAIIRLFVMEEPGLSLAEAWKAHVPVIAISRLGFPPPAAAPPPPAAAPLLYARTGDPASLADKLMLIYKDEALRSSLVENGAARGESLSWQRTAELIRAALTN